MRRKSVPPQAASPPKRARPVSSTDTTVLSMPAPHWVHTEWFQSALDHPYFTHSDFHAVVADRMAQLSDSLSSSLTQAKLRRIRTDMLKTLPGGFVQPRRLSSQFLHVERAELAMYRTDARRVLRGLDLLPSLDPTTGDQLPQNWWSRYRCAPPKPLSRGAQVLVRTLTQPSQNPQPSKPAQLHLLPAIFLSLEADAHNRVRLQHDASEHIVSDLDVMIHPASSSNSNSVAQSPLLPNLQPFDRSPASARFSFSPSTMPGPIFDFSTFPDASQSVIQLYQSPRPTIVSPRRPLEVKTQRGDQYECDVDVHRIAESMRLLDKKEQLLSSLKLLNDAVSATTEPGHPPSEATAAKYDSILSALEQVNAEINMHLEPHRSNPHPPPPNLYISTDMDSAKFEHTPERRTSLPMAMLKVAPTSPVHQKRDAGSPGGTLAHSPQLRPENMAKNVDFRAATGTALLAKALTKAALSKLPQENGLKSAPAPVRADVMECVSACVAVLVRARTTRDFHCVDELIDGLRSRFPANAEAIDAIQSAAKVLETSSSDGG